MDADNPTPLLGATRHEKDWTIIELKGAIDYSRSGELADELDRLSAGPGPRVLLNLSDVEYLDTTGLATLVELRNRLHAAGGQLVLCRVPERVRGLIRVTHLRDLLEVVGDEAAVLGPGAQ